MNVLSRSIALAHARTWGSTRGVPALRNPEDRVIQQITHQKPASRPVMTGRSGAKSISAVSGIASVMASFFYLPLTSDMSQPLTGHERFSVIGDVHWTFLRLFFRLGNILIKGTTETDFAAQRACSL
ncbi:hypothetical protein ACVWWU_000440 [Pantoea sp. PA1]|jgi:hypothetical protein|uniref:hypothetical protein n=2 Tax=Pantoea ananas TaxID=553 RepID=UPI000AA9A148|nr:hypothetical protein [Pantoea ananatis]MDH0051560.1 hypothetical protein [Pantoea ananatis]